MIPAAYEMQASPVQSPVIPPALAIAGRQVRFRDESTVFLERGVDTASRYAETGTRALAWAFQRRSRRQMKRAVSEMDPGTTTHRQGEI